MPLTVEENKTALFLSNLFARLNKEKIAYCVLRNYETLPEKVSNDVDIWVKDREQKKFEEVLFNVAHNYKFELVSRIPRFGFKCDIFLSSKNNHIEIIHIDYWWQFCWRNLSWIDTKTLEKGIILSEKGLFIPSPGAEASTLLLQNLLYYGKVKEKYKNRILALANEDSKGFYEAILKPFGNNIAKLILVSAKNGEWSDLEAIHRRLRLTILKNSLRQNSLSQFQRLLIYIFGQLKDLILHNRGIFIVLIGPDGSGKSTTCKNLMDSEIKKLFQKQLYFHGHFPFLPELKSIVAFFARKKNIEASVAVDNLASDLKPFGMLRAMIYPIYYGFNYFLGHFLVWKEKARAGLVIFDRYFYDYMIQKLYTKCPGWFLHLITKIIPQADILIYLKNNPKTIYDRKPELSIEEIQRQSKICEDITRRFKNSFVIDTSISQDQVVKKIQQIIINKIKEKNYEDTSRHPFL